MAKNDFDYNYDASSEEDFDPQSFLDSNELNDDIDFSEFTDEELGLSSADAENLSDSSEDMDADFNLDGLDLGEDFQLDVSADDSYDEYLPQDDDEELPAEDPENVESQLNEDPPDQEQDPEEEQEESMYQEDEEESRRKNKRKRKTPSEKSIKITLPKLHVPNFFQKFFDIYFAPIANKEMREAPADPNNPRRRRRKTRGQIFKEVYLPPIIACLCLILVLSFVIGSVSNLIEQKRIDDERKQSHLQSSESAAELEAQRVASLMQQAADLAQQYDYDKAIEALKSIGDLNTHPDIAAKVSEYVTAQSQLEEHKDPSLIPNLSFNLLIEDMARAKADQEFGGLYNKNFVTTGEFRKILDQLYNNGYVLVDFDSFTESREDTSGAQVYMSKPILLPNGKKPIMITETLVNYFNYMIDGNDDKVPDAQGDGFATRLVVKNGEIKAEYVDTAGQTQVGDYDLVPILETFIKEHPDFSYRGARAILAVTGHEGIFGYRITSDYTSTKGQDYVNQEIADCKVVVQALRDKGYTLACNTFKNLAYGQKSVAEITADLQSWTQQIVPVIGDVNVFIFVRNSPISSYTDAAFQAIYDRGFRYFVAEGATPWAEINPTYVRQNRILVSGNTMAWKTTNFTSPSMIFDPAAVLDITNRGQVPN